VEGEKRRSGRDAIFRALRRCYRKEISQLELNGRNFTQLVTLVPGVSNQTGQDESGVGLNGNISYALTAAVASSTTTGRSMAPITWTPAPTTRWMFFPSVDAIAEFRVQHLKLQRRVWQGMVPGNIEVTTKSGTKSFHGDAYEFLRNEAFNANDFFNNAAGNSRPSYKKHDFGYTIGGPVFIPHHYNTTRIRPSFLVAGMAARAQPISFNQQVPLKPGAQWQF